MYNLLLEPVKLHQKITFLDWKACLNLPEPLLCLFLVYRLREIWLWGTVQHRSLEKRRTAIKPVLERSDDSWVSSRPPSLDLLTVTEVEMLGFVSPSSFPLLCLCSTRLQFFSSWMGQHARTSGSGSMNFLSFAGTRTFFFLRIRCAQSPDWEIRAGGRRRRKQASFHDYSQV